MEYLIKSCSAIITSLLLATNSSFAQEIHAQNATSKLPQAITEQIANSKTILRQAVPSCFNKSQFFKFINSYSGSQFGIYADSLNFDVISNMNKIQDLGQGESQLFANTFSANNQAVRTGVAYWYKDKKHIEPLCGITFSCQCNEAIGCFTEVIINGAYCKILGDGIETDPYVFAFIAKTDS